MRYRAFLVAAACALTPAHAADLAKTGPLAPAAGLIAARQTLQEPALEVNYALDGAAAPITVDLAEDFTTLLRGDEIYIYDYALRRVIALDDKAHKFTNNSLYGLVDFRVAETANRRRERKLLAGAQNLPDGLDPFWVQSELHVVDPEDGLPALERRADKAGTVHFLYKGKEVASYAPSKQKLTAAQSAKLARFLKTYAAVHPRVVDDIAASGVLPARLAFVTQPKGDQTVWTLQSSAEVKSAYPLYASARVPTPRVDTSVPLVAALLPVMTAALASQAPGKRSLEDDRAEITKALARGRPFAAMLLTMEQMEQYGPHSTECANDKGCPPYATIGAAAKDDPRSPVLFASLQPAPGQVDMAVKNLREMKRDDLSDVYYLDDFAANDLVGSGRSTEAFALFEAAIKGNPYMPGFYKDAGDAFRFGYDPATAWLFYDLGRALPGAADAQVISVITDHEADLARAHPEFF